jgi:hypothetical protein
MFLSRIDVMQCRRKASYILLTVPVGKQGDGSVEVNVA